MYLKLAVAMNFSRYLHYLTSLIASQGNDDNQDCCSITALATGFPDGGFLMELFDKTFK